MLLVAYDAGLRAAEICRLHVTDIDSVRMLVRVRQGKGRKDRYINLSGVLLEILLNTGKPTARGSGYSPGRHLTSPLTRLCCRTRVARFDVGPGSTRPLRLIVFDTPSPRNCWMRVFGGSRFYSGIGA